MGDHLARLAAAAADRVGTSRLYFEGAWHTGAELHARAVRVSAGLRALGVGPGDRVVVMMANCPEVGVTYTAVWRAGGVVTPVIFLVSPAELRHAIVDSGAVAVVTTGELLPAIRRATEGLAVKVVVAGATGEPGVADYADLESAGPAEIVDRSPDDLAALLYTGGTTGRSKGVPLSHANLAQGGAASRSVSYVPGLNCGLLALPLAHSYGILVTVGAMHATEPPVTVLMRWFDAARWLELAQEHGVEVTAVVPSMLAMLLGQPLEQYDLGTLRHVYCGAAPLSPALAVEFERRVPSATVLEGYGCTETGGIISTTPPDRRRLGTVGIPVPGVRVRIVGADGRTVPTGTDGEVVVSGPNVMAGYWHDDPDESSAVTDGWLATGDIGRLDPDGYLSIVDRKKDLVIRGGYNIYPRDVEDVLLTHPGVAGAAVVGRPDPRLGEEVVAFVALRADAGVTPEELVTFARERLSPTKYPREVRVIDAIPLTSVGKVDRKWLRAAVHAEAAAATPEAGAGVR